MKKIITTIHSHLILTIIVIVITTVFISSQILVTKASVEELVANNDELFTEVSMANHEISELTIELDKYKSIEASIKSLGASDTEAQSIIKAAEAYDINPLMLGALCKTESEFTQNCKHDLPYVIGAFGISTKDHTDLPANPNTFYGNAKCSAFILRQNLDKYDGNYKKAITAYKGICKTGRARADQVIKIKKDIS